jgi:hypothetical protein
VGFINKGEATEMIRLAAASFIGFTLLTAAGCIDEGSDVSATVQESHSWGGYHWARTTSSFTLDVGDNVSSEWDGVLNTTISDWTQSTVLNLNKVAGAATTKRCKGSSGKVEVCNARYGNNGWLGIASISLSGGHISSGTVKLNDTYFSSPQYNTTAWRNLVSCQEVGHTLGLDHQDENFDNPPLGTCMDYTSDPSPNQHPNAHDYDQLKTIYQHLDSTTTVGATGGHSNGASDNPAEWGELMSSSRGGQQETYVKEHGNGDATVTFVTWANE